MKRCAIVLEGLGALLLAAYLLGAFEYPERVELYQAIARGEKVPPTTDAARELLEDFHYLSNEEANISHLLRPEPTWERPRGDGVYVVIETGDRQLLGDISDVRSWSGAESTTYGWLSFGLIVAGISISAFLLRTEGAHSRNAAQQGDEADRP